MTGPFGTECQRSLPLGAAESDAAVAPTAGLVATGWLVLPVLTQEPFLKCTGGSGRAACSGVPVGDPAGAVSASHCLPDPGAEAVGA
jgi:hypothetical protein